MAMAAILPGAILIQVTTDSVLRTNTYPIRLGEPVGTAQTPFGAKDGILLRDQRSVW